MCGDLAPIDHLLEATVQTFIFPSQVLNKILLLGLDLALHLTLPANTKFATALKQLYHYALMIQLPKDKSFSQLFDILLPQTTNPKTNITFKALILFLLS